MKKICILIALILLSIPVLTSSRVIEIRGTKAADPWAGFPLLKRIASCEDFGVPGKEPIEFLPDGSVLRGKINPDDVGLGQINLPTWGAKAIQIGLNLYTYEGNLAMMKWIYLNDPRHEQNWSWSESCWGVDKN